MSASKVLKSYYSGKTPEEREQEVRTPVWLWEYVIACFGGTCHLDPCAATDPLKWYAEINVHLPENSLDYDWTAARSVYINPPFDDLGPWFDHVEHTARSGTPIIMLSPCRVNRLVFSGERDAVGLTRAKSAHSTVVLSPFAFDGHKDTFTQSLVLLSWNVELPPMGARELGRFQWIS